MGEDWTRDHSARTGHRENALYLSGRRQAAKKHGARSGARSRGKDGSGTVWFLESKKDQQGRI